MISFASSSGELHRKGKKDQFAKMCPVKEGDQIQVRGPALTRNSRRTRATPTPLHSSPRLLHAFLHAFLPRLLPPASRQVETRMSKGEVTFKVFDPKNRLKASQTCGEIAFLNTFAVALGPV